MPLSVTTARLIIFGLYLESLSGITGKSPHYVKVMWNLLQHLDSIQEIEASLSPEVAHKWNNYKLLWPHEDMTI